MVRRNSWSRGGRASAGFTLVELLVVISIIAMLMALLLPAVQSARETARRNTCQNNQKNVGFALMSYNDAKKSYPGWNNWLNSTAASNSTNVPTTSYLYAQVTYVVPLLPYLEQNVIYGNYTAYLNNLISNGSASSTTATNELSALAASQVYMALLVCPSNPPVSQVGATPLAYVINGGQIPVADAIPLTTSLKTYTAVQIQSMAPASGISYDLTGLTNATGVSPVRVSQDFVNSHDGTTYTLLLSENTLTTSSWSLLSNITGSLGMYSAYVGAMGMTGVTIPPTAALAIPQQFATTFMWANSGAVSAGSVPPSYFAINGDKTNTGATDYYHARPASNHTGVSVFTFCGGNVRSIAEDIDYRVFKQLMTPFGGSTNTNSGISGSGDWDSMLNPLDESKF